MNSAKTVIILLLLFAGLPLWAQDDEFRVPDSLMAKLKEFRGTDLTRAKALDDVIMFYFDEHKITNAAGYINDLGDVANSICDNYWMAKSHYYKALCAYEKYDNAEFLTQVNKALRLTETLRESKDTQLLLARIYLVKSAAFFNNNLLPECQESIDKGFQIAEKYEFQNLKHSFFTNSGALLVRLRKYNDAVNVFKENLKYKFELGGLLNLASSYGKLQQYDSVFYYADSIIRYANSLKKMNGDDAYQLINAYQVKAAGFIELRMWDQAIQCLDKSDEYMAQYGDVSLLSSELFYRADALRGMGQNEQALETVDDAIESAVLANQLDIEWYAVKLKSDILDNMKAYEEEVKNMRYFNSLTDTIKNKEDVEKLQLQEFQRETFALEQQYKQQQAVMQQRHRFLVLLFTFLIVVGILIFIIFSLNRKRKLETTAAVLETRNREVTTKTMEQMHLNQVLEDVVAKLTHFVHNPKDNDNAVDNAIRDLKGLITDGSEKDFDYFFTQVQPDFYKRLQADFPELTPNDLRLCAFIKGHLNVKEVAELTGISADSVKSARSRLRKKLGIADPNASLSKFLGKY